MELTKEQREKAMDLNIDTTVFTTKEDLIGDYAKVVDHANKINAQTMALCDRIKILEHESKIKDQNIEQLTDSVDGLQKKLTKKDSEIEDLEEKVKELEEEEDDDYDFPEDEANDYGYYKIDIPDYESKAYANEMFEALSELLETKSCRDIAKILRDNK